MSYAHDAIDYMTEMLNQNKKEQMIDELLGGKTPVDGTFRLCHRTATLEIYRNGEWIVA